MNQHLKKLSEEILHDNPWFKYKHDIFEFTDGRKGDYYYLETNGCVMIVPILDDGRLVLISQHRYLLDRLSIEFPCGGIHTAESPQQSAERELLEETGYSSTGFVKMGVFEGLNGAAKDGCHVFIANEMQKTSEQVLDEMENLEVIYRRPDEVDEMVRKNEIWDGKTLAAWAMIHHQFLY